jgi:hypothetical protein
MYLVGRRHEFHVEENVLIERSTTRMNLIMSIIYINLPEFAGSCRVILKQWM